MIKSFKENLKKKIFPIKNSEINKILAICALKGLISTIYSVLSNVKDAFVVGAKGSGAETIPVLKGFIVLPISLIFVIIYSNMSNRFKPTTVFYSIMTFFAISFIFYGFILSPNEEYLTPTNSAQILADFLGPNNTHWVAVYKNWMHAFFYLLAELWSQASIFILFWEFVNRVCSIDEAKRSYNLFIAAGSLFNCITAFSLFYFIKYFISSFDSKVKILMIYIFLCIILLIIVYYFLNKESAIKKSIKQKTKLSFFQGIKYIASSRYLISIAITVLAVGLTINLVEVTWKANLKLLYPNKTGFVTFITKINGFQNLLTLLVVFFVSGNSLRERGWKLNAQITPYVILITGVLFFLSSKYKGLLFPLASTFGISTLKVVVYLGVFQVISSKISKYCFYDLTKEIAYIPLDNEAKVKGKAAIDSVGSRLGKSGSSYIHLAVLWLASTSSVLNVTMFLIPILILICGIWLFSINYISKKLKKFTKQIKND